MGKDKGEASKRAGIKAVPPGYRQLSFGSGGRTSVDADLRDVPGFAAIVQRIAEAGDAIIFSKTSDGGAYAITLLSDDRREKAYASSQAELDEVFALLGNDYPEEPGT